MTTAFERGRYAVHDLMINLAGETGTFNRGYAAGVKTQGIRGPFMSVIDGKSADGEDDPDGYDAGFEAAHETVRQLAMRSADFQAGWIYELRRPIEEQAKAREVDTAVFKRVEVKLAEQNYIKALVAWKVAKAKGLADETTHPDPRIRDAANLKFIADFDERADFERRVENKMLDMRIARGEMMYEPMTHEESLAAKDRFWSGQMKTASPSDPNRPAWRRFETKDGPMS
jgi:hypothetical protein